MPASRIVTWVFTTFTALAAVPGSQEPELPQPAARSLTSLLPLPHNDGTGATPTGAVGRLGGWQFRLREPRGLSAFLLAASTDGSTVAYFADDPDATGRLAFRSLTGGEPRLYRHPTAGYAEFLAVSPDGSAVAVPWGNTVTVAGRNDGSMQALTIPGPASPGFNRIVFSADGKRVAAGGWFAADTARVVVWDRAAGKLLLHATPVHRTHVFVALSADGKTAVSAGATILANEQPGPNDMVHVWDVDAGVERTRFRAPQPFVSIAASPDGRRVALAAHHGVVIHDAASGKVVRTLGTPAAHHALAFAPDGKRLAALAPDRLVRVWDTETGRVLVETPAPPGATPLGLTFTAPDRGLAWGSRDRAAAVWEFPSGTNLTPANPHGRPVSSVAFSADGKAVFSGDADGVVMEWEPARPAGANPMRLRDAEPPVAGRSPVILKTTPVIIAPGGRYVALVDSRTVETARVFERQTSRVVFGSKRAQSSREPHVFAPDGEGLFVPHGYDHRAGRHEPAGVVEVSSGKRRMSLPMGTTVEGAAFSPDGRRLATVRQADERDIQGPREVVLWDVVTGEKLGEIVTPDRGSGGVVAVADSGSAVLGYGTRLVALDVRGGRVGDTLDQLNGRQGGQIGAVVFNPDGKLIAAGLPIDDAGGFGVRIYEWPSGRRRHEFRGHTGRVTALAFSSDGKLLASGSEDTNVVVWDMSALGKR